MFTILDYFYNSYITYQSISDIIYVNTYLYKKHGELLPT